MASSCYTLKPNPVAPQDCLETCRRISRSSIVVQALGRSYRRVIDRYSGSELALIADYLEKMSK